MATIREKATPWLEGARPAPATAQKLSLSRSFVAFQSATAMIYNSQVVIDRTGEIVAEIEILTSLLRSGCAIFV